MPFISDLDTRAVEPGEWALLNDFGYEFELDRIVYRLTVPRAFITDLASVPWIAQILPGFSVDGASRWAAIPHDYLYCCQGRVKVAFLDELGGQVLGEPRKVTFTRAQCDDIFHKAILDVGRDEITRDLVADPYSRFEARLFWLGVRAGGWAYWEKRHSGLSSEDFANLEFVQPAGGQS